MTDTEKQKVIEVALDAANLATEKQQQRAFAALCIRAGAFVGAVAIIVAGYGDIQALKAAVPTVSQTQAHACRDTRRTIFVEGLSDWVNALDDLEERKSTLSVAQYDRGRLAAFRALRPIVEQVKTMRCPVN